MYMYIYIFSIFFLPTPAQLSYLASAPSRLFATRAQTSLHRTVCPFVNRRAEGPGAHGQVVDCCFVRTSHLLSEVSTAE